MTIKEASLWASRRLGKNVTPSNIAYLIQYGRIRKRGENGGVRREDLEFYYANFGIKETEWKKQLGDDLNWNLSFAQYKESETTKHVHRLHPYKGKFIPQLVEYFLDGHTDRFKQSVFFHKGDIVLDPFCGSGTTLVQANELGLHALGIDVSSFNAFISNVKVGRYPIGEAMQVAHAITRKLQILCKTRNHVAFENELSAALQSFNAEHFPSPTFIYRVRHGEIDEKFYGFQKAESFLKIYNALVEKHHIRLHQKARNSFLDQWFLQVVRDEIDFVLEHVLSLQHLEIRKIMMLILSRTVRSSRATTHADLGTLKEPVTTSYYCKKHSKICRPLFSISRHWQRYVEDTMRRLSEFSKIHTNTFQQCLIGDSRTMDIFKSTKKPYPDFGKLIEDQKIAGIFSSPPYVGMIDYHEQHRYSYDMFGLDRADHLEIGSLSKGQSMDARKNYICGIADVLCNCKRFLKENYNVFLVANDKYGLYPEITKLAGMKIVGEYKRPVLNRVEKDRSAYSEIIFHMKKR